MIPGLAGKTDWFEDSTCMVFVFVRAQAEQVASVFGRAQQVWRTGKQVASYSGDEVGIVAQPEDSSWAVVRVHDSHPAVPTRYDDFLEEERPDPEYDICLQEQDEAAWNLQVPEGPPRYAAPVTTAAMAARTLRTEALALWGSDEVPATGAALLDASGKLQQVLSKHAHDSYGSTADTSVTILEPGVPRRSESGYVLDRAAELLRERGIILPSESWIDVDDADTLVGLTCVWHILPPR